MFALILSLLVSVGLVSDSRTANAEAAARSEHTPTFAEVACFVECPQHCLWPSNPWAGPVQP